MAKYLEYFENSGWRKAKPADKLPPRSMVAYAIKSIDGLGWYTSHRPKNGQMIEWADDPLTAERWDNEYEAAAFAKRAKALKGQHWVVEQITRKLPTLDEAMAAWKAETETRLLTALQDRDRDRAEFLKRFAQDPLDAIEWYSKPLVLSETYGREAADLAEHFEAVGWDPAQCHQVVIARKSEIIERILIDAGGNHSTSPWANALEDAKREAHAKLVHEGLFGFLVRIAWLYERALEQEAELKIEFGD